MSKTLLPLVVETYREQERMRYIKFLDELGSNISFEDNTWFCDKKIRSFSQQKSDVSLSFSSIPDGYREAVKFFALVKLLKGNRVISVATKVSNLKNFFNFLPDGMPLHDIGMDTALKYQRFLDSSSFKPATKYALWNAIDYFIRTVSEWEGEAVRNPFRSNPYIQPERHDYKYIPERVAQELDSIFMRDIPDGAIKCIYWIMRLIPSRISEALGMPIDCLKPYLDHFCLFIPTWKQNGGHREPIQRVIHIEDKGMGGYLLEQVRKQQSYSSSSQELMPESKRGGLFTCRKTRSGKKHNGNKPSCRLMTPSAVNAELKQICHTYNIRDDDGEMFNLTSHKFRHNGITDRLDAGFTLAQIADMTYHHGTAMLGSYAHLNLKPQTLIEKQRYVLEEKLPQKTPYVLFGGRILGMSEQIEQRLLGNIRAHRVRGGICSDVTGCKNDMWNCLDCPYFIPDRDQLQYFREQAVCWHNKSVTFKEYPMIKANATHNAALFEAIIQRILDNGD